MLTENGCRRIVSQNVLKVPNVQRWMWLVEDSVIMKLYLKVMTNTHTCTYILIATDTVSLMMEFPLTELVCCGSARPEKIGGRLGSNGETETSVGETCEQSWQQFLKRASLEITVHNTLKLQLPWWPSKIQGHQMLQEEETPGWLLFCRHFTEKSWQQNRLSSSRTLQFSSCGFEDLSALRLIITFFWDMMPRHDLVTSGRWERLKVS